MPLTQMPPGLMLDMPPLSAKPYWRWGVNVRTRMGMKETLGLFGPVRNAAGTHLQLPGADPYRSIRAVPAPGQGQIIAGSVSAVAVLSYDAGSLPGTGTRWTISDITPAAMPPALDVVSDPGVGRVEIPPAWWWAEQEDIVVGGRANDTGTGVYVWDRNPANPMTPIANAPAGAVGGGVISRLLVLLGCQSFTDPDPQRFMTIRWSDRFNFEEWTPSDINVSGELQLDGGSRIVGGGVVDKGVLAWTDKRMALLTETGDPNSIFNRQYIDGGRGLMANRSWCEADGRVWWYDETRTLNVWDGGAPVQIENPLRSGTIERITDRAIARAELIANPEFSEIILNIGMADPDMPDAQIIYNYADKAWDFWKLPRLAWAQRVSAIRTLGIDHSNRVYQHDLDTGLGAKWLPASVPPFVGYNPLDDVTPYDWELRSCLITAEDPERQAYHVTRQLADHTASPATGSETDTFDLTLRAYGEPRIDATVYEDTQTISQGQTFADYRSGGRAIEIVAEGTGKTVWRFGATSRVMGGDGER